MRKKLFFTFHVLKLFYTQVVSISLQFCCIKKILFFFVVEILKDFLKN